MGLERRLFPDCAVGFGELRETGTYTLSLPAAAFANGGPLYVCYISNSQGRSWSQLTGRPASPGDPYCELNGRDAGITIHNAVAGWLYYVIAWW